MTQSQLHGLQKTTPSPFLCTNILTTMSDLNAYLDKEEAELGIAGQALNMEADADMMSADLENTAEALDPEPPTEVIPEWANLPVDSSDCIPLTTDQLMMV